METSQIIECNPLPSELDQVRAALAEVEEQIQTGNGPLSVLCGKRSDLMKKIAGMTLPAMRTV